MSRSGATNDGTQQVPFFLQRTRGDCLPENVKSKKDPCRARPWLLLHYSVPSQFFSPLPSTAEPAYFLSSVVFMPFLSHSAGSQHHENMSSLYPKHLAQFLTPKRQFYLRKEEREECRSTFLTTRVTTEPAVYHRIFVFTPILTASSPSSPCPRSLLSLWVAKVEFPASSSQHPSREKSFR